MNDPTEAPEPTPAATATTDQSWQQLLAQLRARYPGQKDSVLFCLLKLQQDPQLTLRDIRDEARLHGIPAAGRALHSARVLLGLAEAKPRRKTAKPAAPAATEPASEPAAATARRREPAADDGSAAGIGSRLLEAVEQLRQDADADRRRLEAAMRQAIQVLEQALES